MRDILTYRTEEKIYESVHSVIYRARDKHDNRVILKILSGRPPSALRIARFRREYEILSRIKTESVIKVFSLEAFENSLVMVMEDFGGESLSQQMKKGVITMMSIKELLQLALSLVDCIDSVHRHNIVHKDINPSNFVWNVSDNRVKLIDFGISIELLHERPQMINPNLLEGTLAYISPEQTGRMNRDLDYRTDFYSLGVTLYEIFAGLRPFKTEDDIEMVHAHIAKSPVPLDRTSKRIPGAIAGIVHKLMAKMAEERYQSCFGIRADLNLCLDMLTKTGAIDDFEAGSRDVSKFFQVPQKLYGREHEVQRLLDAFDRVTAGQTEMVLVSGYSGIGKSALIHEIQRPITRLRGYFISGKFDQLKRDIPYDSLICAFRKFFRFILTENREVIEDLSVRLRAALGPNGRVITGVIDELELIIGPQPELPDLPAADSRNRFKIVFHNFIKALIAFRRPLTIFLDDLQWADLPSLNLMEQLLSDRQAGPFLFIGAYRDNEVDTNHPLALSLGRLRAAGAVMHAIKLERLALDYVHRMIIDTVKSGQHETRQLAGLCQKKTDGNPFFLIQLLNSLNRKKMIYYDNDRGVWAWDIDAITRVEATDNVVDLLTRQMSEMSPATREVLQLSSCIGGNFSIRALVVVNEKTIPETMKDLSEALADSLIVPLDDNYKILEYVDDVDVTFRFSHDRVRQAAYAMIPPEQLPVVHLKIGRLMLQQAESAGDAETLFDIVNHLNIGSGLMGCDELLGLARLNLRAAMRAKTSAAYEPAHHYVLKGLSLLGDDAWQEHYDLALDCHIEGAELSYLNGDFNLMEEMLAKALAGARTPLDRARVYEIRIQAFISNNDLLSAVNAALDVLDKLGAGFPRNPGKLAVLASLVGIKARMMKVKVDGLLDHRTMDDPRLIAVMRIMAMILSVSYFVQPMLFPLIVFRMLSLSIKHGNSHHSGVGFVTYGLILSSVLGDIEGGYAIGRTGIELLHRQNVRRNIPQASCIFNSTVRHWKEHVRESFPQLVEDYTIAMETGDLEYASISIVMYHCLLYFSGKNLGEVEAEIVRYKNAVTMVDQKTPNYHSKIIEQTVLNMQGKSENPVRLTGTAYDETSMLQVHLDANDQTALGDLYFEKLALCYCFEEYEEGLECALRVERHKEGITGLMQFPLFYFYDALLRLALCDRAGGAEKRRHLRRARADLKKIMRWARHAPMNYLHKELLVTAELARVCGRDLQAIDCYEKAINAARENGFLNEEALASELAAKFWLSRGNRSIAGNLFQQAVRLYDVWGAHAKSKDLGERYHSSLLQAAPASKRDGTMTRTTSSFSAHQLDMETMIKVSRTILGEKVLDDLLRNILNFVMENAGAQKGFLMLEHGGVLTIELECGSVEGGRMTVHSIVLENHALSGLYVPVSLVNYVARTGECIILNDAAFEGKYVNDPYVVMSKPRSVLCIPLTYQARLVGVLYLENNLMQGVFTEERIHFLNLLSSQMAVSIINARIHRELEDLNRNLEMKVDERTRELNTALTNIREDLMLAKRIQENILPKNIDSLAGLRFRIFYQPMSEIGGDLYDVAVLRKGVVRVFLADATGHGVQAGLVTMLIKSEYETIKESINEPDSVLKILNSHFLGSYREMSVFFSCFIVDIDLRNSKIRYASGGHPTQYLISGDEMRDLAHSGHILGVWPGFTCRTQELPFSKGDKLLLFTDGLYEEFTPDNRDFGEDRIRLLASQHSRLPIDQLTGRIMGDLMDFLGGPENFTASDDITFVGIEYPA